VQGESVEKITIFFFSHINGNKILSCYAHKFILRINAI
jgi:hypothetical protein